MEFKNYYYCSNCNAVTRLNSLISTRNNALIISTKFLHPHIDNTTNIFTLEERLESNKDYIELDLDNTSLSSLNQYIDGMVKCDSCNNESFIIDENIIPIIFTLNTQGVRTKFSCSGHMENKTDADYFYLVIDAVKSDENKLDILVDYLSSNKFKITKEKNIFDGGEIMVVRGSQKENSLVNVNKLTTFLIENEL